LLGPGAFDSTVMGCDCVMHTASPYIINVANPHKELVEPAVEGTLNVLRSCAAAKIPKVVLTSSMASVTDSPAKGHVYTEADWNTESSLTRNPYYFSKTEAEKAAWAYVKSLPEPFKLLVCNPFVIIGPEPTGEVNTSNAILRDLMLGTFPAVLDLGWAFVDVRDVAAAHLLCMENPAAEGRHLIINEFVHMKDVVEFLGTKYTGYHLPHRDLSCGLGTALVKVGSHFGDKGTGQYLRTNLGTVCMFNTAKVQGLGLTYRPVLSSIADTIDDMVTRGQLAPGMKAPAKKH